MSLEVITAELLKLGKITPVEFEEFWFRYDNLLIEILDAQETMAEQTRFFNARTLIRW